MKEKTIKEVKQHCLENGYNLKSRTQICAFLVGARLKEIDCAITFKVGNGSFSDFISWFYSDNEEMNLERGTFVIVEEDSVASIILDVFKDWYICLRLGTCVRIHKTDITQYADAISIHRCLKSLSTVGLTWDVDEKKLKPTSLTD
jgi:hypothetical protein